MPELPEVETTLRGLAPYLHAQAITAVTVRRTDLRQPIPANLAKSITHQTVSSLERRSKYMLLHLANRQTLLIHLGMSGRFTTYTTPTPPAKHTHVILTTPKAELHFTDPRRFGLCLLIPTAKLATHPLLKHLGPEPLSPAFSGKTLHTAIHTKKTAVKPTLMDAKVVVGVGNIYASESLFRSHIHPKTPCSNLTLKQCEVLAGHIRQTLTDAITAGGSTLRDYRHGDGQLGYFQHQFNVYGRKGESCPTCGTPIEHAVMAQRSTYWCPTCQPLKANKKAPR